MIDGIQTEDERALADLCVPYIRLRPGMNVLALVGNLNGAAKKSKYATEEVYRACSSDNRFHSVRDPESGLTMFMLRETP